MEGVPFCAGSMLRKAIFTGNSFVVLPTDLFAACVVCSSFSLSSSFSFSPPLLPSTPSPYPSPHLPHPPIHPSTPSPYPSTHPSTHPSTPSTPFPPTPTTHPLHSLHPPPCTMMHGTTSLRTVEERVVTKCLLGYRALRAGVRSRWELRMCLRWGRTTTTGALCVQRATRSLGLRPLRKRQVLSTARRATTRRRRTLGCAGGVRSPWGPGGSSLPAGKSGTRTVLSAPVAAAPSPTSTPSSSSATSRSAQSPAP